MNSALLLYGALLLSVVSMVVAILFAIKQAGRNDFLRTYTRELESVNAGLRQQLAESKYREQVLESKLLGLEKSLSVLGYLQLKDRLKQFFLSHTKGE